MTGKDKQADLTSDFTPFSRREKSAAGKATGDFYSVPAFKRDGQAWEPIDTQVVASDEAGTVAEAPDAYTPVRFGADDSRLVEMSLPDGGVLATASDDLDLGDHSVTPTGVVYRKVKPGADLEYAVSPSGVKEQLVLSTKAATERSYTFILTDSSGSLGELSGDETNGFHFAHGTRDGVGLALSAPTAYSQAEGAASAEPGSAHMSVKKLHGAYKVTVSVDDDWLKGQDLPIVLDPTINYDAQAGDVAARTGQTTDNTASRTVLKEGTDQLKVGGSPDYRSYLKFDFNGLTSVDRISTATLLMQRPTDASGCTPSASACDTVGMTLNRLSSAVLDSDTGQAAKNRSDDSTTTGKPIAVAATSTGKYSADVKSQLTDWLTGVSTNYGWSLRATNTTTAQLKLIGTTAPGTTAAQIPYVQVSYENFYNWVEAAPAAAKAALTNRRLGTAAYDWGAKQVVLFGGTTGTTAFDAAGAFFTGALNDTWIYDGNVWNQVNYSTTNGGIAPPALVGATMAYNPVAKATYLFGGRLSDMTYNAITYKWDGTKWTNANTSAAPSGRAYAAMAYLPPEPDGNGGGIYLYGGKDASGARNDLWRFNSTTSMWNQIAQSGPAMPNRFGANLLFKDRGRFDATGNGVRDVSPLVLFGGETGGFTKLSDTYEMVPSGSASVTWTRVAGTSTTQPASLTARRFAAAAWDPNNHWDILAGGQDANGTLSDFYYYGDSWDGKTTGGPVTRAESAYAFDADTGEFVVVGGFDSTTSTIAKAAGPNSPGYYDYLAQNVDESQSVSTGKAASGAFAGVFVPGEPVIVKTTATNRGKANTPVGISTLLPPELVASTVVSPTLDDNGTTVSCPPTSAAGQVRCVTLNNIVTTINYSLAPQHTLTLTVTASVNLTTSNCASLIPNAVVNNSNVRLTYKLNSTTYPGPEPLGSLIYTKLQRQTARVCGNGLGLENWWSFQRVPVGAQSSGAVNVANGNLVVQSLDSTAVQGRGHLAYVLRRTYNSQTDPVLTLPGSLGAGWQLNLGEATDLGETGLDSSQLSIPAAAADPTTLTAPLSVTLTDRDGTRHVYTPKSNFLTTPLTAAASNGLAPLSGGGLAAQASTSTICIDAAYQAPAGVHLGLWRYVKLAGGSCASPTGTTTILGYATERTDRLRGEYSAAGKLTDLYDGAGVDLRYAYDTSIQTPGGQLTAIFEPSSTCTSANILTSSSATCRKFKITREASNSSHLNTTLTTVTDPAGRATVYETYQPTGATAVLDRVVNPNPTSTTDAVIYTYSGDQHTVTGDDPLPTDTSGLAAETAARWGCSTVLHQLCSIRDGNGHRTYLHYASATGLGLVGVTPLAVDKITDRRGTVRAFTYTPATTSGGTTTAPSTTVVTDPNGPMPHQDSYLGIDAYDRVTVMKQGPVPASSVNVADSSYPALHETDFAWDSDQNQGAFCTSTSVTTRQNNLCSLVRVGSPNGGSTVMSTPDDHTDCLYDDTGLPQRTSRVLGGSALITTMAYRRQYASGSSLQVADQTVQGNGQVAFASGATPSAIGSTLYTLADPIESLSPRGNTAGATVSDFRVTMTPDTPAQGTSTVFPNTVPGTNPCAAATPDGNTGLMCKTVQPLVGTQKATASSTYDTFGEKLTATRPNGGVYRYAYSSGTTDLSGSTQSDGWLARVTDPLGSFVAFAYDAAGNVARTWDRDATSKAPGANYNAPLASSPAGYSAVLRGAGAVNAAAAYSKPWRYQLLASDQLGDTTTSTVDVNGSMLTVKNPRGNTTVMTYDNGDLLLSKQMPVEGATGTGQTRWTYQYDAFGNQTRTNEPNADAPGDVADPTGNNNPKATIMAFDTVNRPIRVDRARSDDAISAANPLPPGCGDNTNRTYVAAIPANRVCTSKTVYDTVDNVIRVTDATGQNTDSAFDDVHRMTAKLAPTHDTGRHDQAHVTITPQTAWLYDADGNVTVICQPRHYSEPSVDPNRACTSSSPYAQRFGYDLADRKVTSVVSREGSATYDDTSFNPVSSGSTNLVMMMVYDADNNVTETRDPGYLLDSSRRTVTTFDLLDRAVAVAKPGHGGAASLTTYQQYSPSGDVVATIEPGIYSSADHSRDTNVNTPTRVTGYAYDAAHRRRDQVKALQVNASQTNPPSFATGTATTIVSPTTATIVFGSSGVATAYTAGAANNNQHTHWEYDADGHVTDTWEPRAFAASGTVDDRFHSHSDYDNDDRPLSQISPRFDDSGVTDLNNASAQSSQCKLAARGYPTGTHVCVTGMAYDQTGNLTKVTLPSSDGVSSNRYLMRNYTFDDLLATETAPDPSAAAGSTARVASMASTYDGLGRQVTMSDALSHVTKTDYYPDGLARSVTRPPGTGASQRGAGDLQHVTTSYYDANGNVMDVEQPVTVDTDGGSGTSLAATTTFTDTTYLTDNLQASVSTPSSAAGATAATNTYVYGYDLAGNTSRVASPSAVALPAGGAYSSGSVALRMITQHFPDNSVKATFQPYIANASSGGDSFRRTRYAYDDAGRKTSQAGDRPLASTAGLLTDTSAFTAGSTQDFSYTPADLLTVETARGTGAREAITHSYDASGNQVSVTDQPVGGSAVATSMSYYLDGSLRSSSQSGRTTAYSYNGRGALLARSDGTGSAAATFAYGDADQVLTFTDPNVGTTTYTNDALGRLATQTDPASGVVASWTYNADDNLGMHQVSKSGVTAPLAQQSYTYDELDRQLTQAYTGTDGQTGTTSTYTYNRSGTLKTFQNGSGATVQSAAWDANGNRTSWNLTSDPSMAETWAYHADNSIDTDKVGSANPVQYMYDVYGNQISDGCHGLTPDGFDRTGSRETGGAPPNCTKSGSVSYTYDGLDRQVSHSDATTGTTTEFYDGPSSALLAETSTGATPSGTTTYALDNTDSAVGINRTNAGATVLPPAGTQRLFDEGHGNIATITTTFGTSSCQDRYDPFGSSANTTAGAVTSCAFPANPAASLTGNTLAYNGLRRDANTGSYQMGSRTYDPSKASFTSADNYRAAPAAASSGLTSDPLTANTYGFVNGDSVNLTDLSGHGTDDQLMGRTQWRNNENQKCDKHCQQMIANAAARSGNDDAKTLYGEDGVGDCIQRNLVQAEQSCTGLGGAKVTYHAGFGGNRYVEVRLPHSATRIFCWAKTQACDAISSAGDGIYLSTEINAPNKLDEIVEGIEDKEFYLKAIGAAAGAKGLAELASVFRSGQEVAQVAAEDATAGAAKAEQYVYRVHGGDSGPMGHSWTPENPMGMSNPRAELGLPKGNSGQMLTRARVNDMEGVMQRDALPLDGNPGGAPEWLFPDPMSQLDVHWTIPLVPPW